MTYFWARYRDAWLPAKYVQHCTRSCGYAYERQHEAEFETWVEVFGGEQMRISECVIGPSIEGPPMKRRADAIPIDAGGNTLDSSFVRACICTIEMRLGIIPPGAEWVMGVDQAAQWENSVLVVVSIKPAAASADFAQLGRREATMAGIPIRRFADFPVGCVSLRVGEREIAAISGLAIPALYGA